MLLTRLLCAKKASKLQSSIEGHWLHSRHRRRCVAHQCNQLNHVNLSISMPRFKSIVFYYNSPKIKLFLQKNAKFSSAERWGLCPPTPSLRNRIIDATIFSCTHFQILNRSFTTKHQIAWWKNLK